MSSQPNAAVAAPSATTAGPKENAPALPAESKEFGESFEKIVAEEITKLKGGPKQITHEDSARIQSVEHKALGFRPPPGSAAAQVQSMSDKVENLHKVVDAAQKKLDEDPASVNADDAKKVLSAEHKVLGHIPPKDSISATVQRAAAANDRSTQDGATTEKAVPAARGRRQSIAAADQSPAAREQAYQAVAEEMKDKLEKHPEDITKADANLLRSADTRAHGATEKGSITSQVQSEVAKHVNGAKSGEPAAVKAVENTTVTGDAKPYAPAETVVMPEDTAKAGNAANGA